MDSVLKGVRSASSFGLKIWSGFSTMATSAKTIKLKKKIGTHNGTFHCDEALACYMLKKLPEWRDAEIVRTREQKILDSCEIVVDVGAVYNLKTNRFDHHQREFKESMTSVRPDLFKDKTIKLSSAGLVYAHYGEQVIRQLLAEENYPISANCISNLMIYVYDGFIEELDAIDNGVSMYADGMPRYRINTHLSARVNRLNPKWNSPVEESNDLLFEKAMKLVGGEFFERVIEAATVWWPARQIIYSALKNNRLDVYKSGEIVVLAQHCPWKDHLFTLEEELGLKGIIKFVVFVDSENSWRVQGVPIQPDSFVCRVFLHQKWRGIRNEDLSEVSGIEGCIFCHSTGFIGGHKTKDGAIKMAILSLESPAADRE